MPLQRRPLLTGAAALALGPFLSRTTPLATAQTAPPSNLASAQPIHLARFGSAVRFAAGQSSGLRALGDLLLLAAGEFTGTWTSPDLAPGFPFSRLVPSWNADTPGASHLRIDVRATTIAGQTTDWYSFGTWAADDTAVQRSSVKDQRDAVARIDTDTLVAVGQPFASATLRVTLERVSADDPSPSLTLVAAQVSAFAYSSGLPTSRPMTGEPVELAVPPLSQEVHARHYPQWGGGGEAWCSPTSTEMVIEYWGRRPTAEALAWVDASDADSTVDYAARSTYDAAYRGTGNWPFNTAYAGRFGLQAFVTQLHSLREAEHFLRPRLSLPVGIPLVASIAARPGELDGFLFAGGTNGHLVVLIGFDSDGRPIVNDPAAWSNGTVRRIYDRAQFERVWLRGSAGTVYVIHPPEVVLPALLAEDAATW
jgi:hypothetical protein